MDTLDYMGSPWFMTALTPPQKSYFKLVPKYAPGRILQLIAVPHDHVSAIYFGFHTKLAHSGLWISLTTAIFA